LGLVPWSFEPLISPGSAVGELTSGGSDALDLLFHKKETNKMNQQKSLYERLGGYDAIAAVSNDLVDRLQKDPQLGRFWQHRGEDGLKRERQLLVDFLCNSTGGPMYYTGRNMKVSHKGMRISENDWSIFLKHADATLKKFNVPKAEYDEVVAFVLSTKADIVEC
jgi:hemoglobin